MQEQCQFYVKNFPYKATLFFSLNGARPAGGFPTLAAANNNRTGSH